jgi:hypothetical protein
VSAAETTVLYIGGMGRSGSTLLEYLLGQVDGYFAAGELKFVWENGLVRNELCGCGTPFRQCPFWSSVGNAAFGGWDAVDPEAVLEAQRQATAASSVARLLAARPAGADFRRFAEHLEGLYRGVRTVAGAEVVVDASKTPVEALVLARVPGIRCRLVHLVRDSRGVAQSWAKKGVRLPQVAGCDATMLSYAPLHTAPRWLYVNLWFELLRTRMPTARLRYEELVASPRAAIDSALSACGAPTEGHDLSVLESGSVRLGALHTLGGNPMRFFQGDQRVRLDDAWKNGLAPRQRRLVTAVTLPLLLRYRYPVVPVKS